MTREYQRNSRTLFQHETLFLSLSLCAAGEGERIEYAPLSPIIRFFSLSTQSSSFSLPFVPFFCVLLLALNTHNDYCREKFCPAKESSREGWMDVLVRWVVDNILPFSSASLLIGMRRIIHAGFFSLIRELGGLQHA
jgi:hypothetical protein